MDQDTRREKLIKLANTMCNGERRTDPGTAEYQVLEYLLTDDELTVMSEMKLITPYTAGMIAKKTGFTKEKSKRILKRKHYLSSSLLSRIFMHSTSC